MYILHQFLEKLVPIEVSLVSPKIAPKESKQEILHPEEGNTFIRIIRRTSLEPCLVELLKTESLNDLTFDERQIFFNVFRLLQTFGKHGSLV